MAKPTRNVTLLCTESSACSHIQHTTCVNIQEKHVLITSGYPSSPLLHTRQSRFPAMSTKPKASSVSQCTCQCTKLQGKHCIACIQIKHKTAMVVILVFLSSCSHGAQGKVTHQNMHQCSVMNSSYGSRIGSLKKLRILPFLQEHACHCSSYHTLCVMACGREVRSNQKVRFVMPRCLARPIQ